MLTAALWRATAGRGIAGGHSPLYSRACSAWQRRIWMRTASAVSGRLLGSASMHCMTILAIDLLSLGQYWVMGVGSRLSCCRAPVPVESPDGQGKSNVHI